MKKYFFMSFVFLCNGMTGYGNTSLENPEGEFIDFLAIHERLCRDNGWQACTILFYKETSEEMFDKSINRSVTWMEIAQKQKEKSV